MKKIIAINAPFDAVKKLYVLDDGQEIYQRPSNVDGFSKDIVNLAKKYGVSQIDLVGPKTYLEHFRQEMYEINNTKFENNDLEINII